MAFKKKSEDTSYRDLKRELASESIGRLYIFHGEEAYLRDHSLKEMREKLLTGGLDEFNHHILPAKDFTLQRLRELVDAVPMMSERTLVEVYDYDIYKGDKDALAELLSDLPDYVCLIFIYDVIPYKPDNRVKLAKLVKEVGREVNFPRQGPDGLITWIQRRFKALGREISADDARYLVFLCGDLMNGLITEIGKISAYAKAERVTRQDIDAVATPQLDAVVFQLTDAISMGNFDKAFSVMSDLLHMQETPIGLLAMLGWQLRRLYTARLAIENGKGAKWLMELWGIGWASTAEKLIQSARRFTLPWCRKAVTRCEEVDLAMKSTGADAGELLTGLLLELAEKRTA